MAFEDYKDDFKKDYFNWALPGYFLTEGTTFYHYLKLYWDIFNNYRNTWIDNVWTPLDIAYVMSTYKKWIDDNGYTQDYIDGDYSHDIEFPFYQTMVNYCSFYGISNITQVGFISLNHMLRILIFKLRTKGFDGSRKRLVEIFNSLGFGAIKFAIQTATLSGSQNARVTFRLITSSSVQNVNFNSTDEVLFLGGYYNIPILGIVYDYVPTNDDSLVYDYTNYSNPDTNDIRYYDGGEEQ